MKKVIGVDLRCLPQDGGVGAGVEHAAREVWETMWRHRSEYEVDLVAYAPKGAFIESEEGIARLVDSSGSALRRALKNRTKKIDRLFVPSGAVAWGIDLPTYPWVHDLVIFDHPEWFPQSWLKRQLTTRLYARGLRRATHLFAVSEDSAHAIQRIAGVEASRITVTYQGSKPWEGELLSPPLIQGEYALILGTVEPRKNIPFITSLWPQVERQLGRPVSLVVAGRDGWGEVPIPSSSSIKRLTIFDEKQRASLIQNASVLLLPSLHEGFGRLALEAMQAGVALIASDRGALPEVVGLGGQMHSLSSPEPWVEAIVGILTSKTEKQRWSQAGRLQASKFNWETVAQTILAKLSGN